jgi:type II secretory pathway pseudopilin PulG
MDKYIALAAAVMGALVLAIILILLIVALVAIGRGKRKQRKASKKNNDGDSGDGCRTTIFEMNLRFGSFNGQAFTWPIPLEKRE